jgi:transcriptional regulator with XRE-family HTH domain
VDDVNNRASVRDFLMSRRARITPAQAGLPVSGHRRVPGLRREEVAVLAGVSGEWYARLEKGHISDVSYDVLDAVARALRLDDEERIYLFDLARAARGDEPDRICGATSTLTLPTRVQWLLDSMTLSSAMISNKRLDVLAVNPLGRALYSPMLESPTTLEHGQANLIRYHFADPGARTFYGDWDVTANVLVGLLRAEAGRDHCESGIIQLVAELSSTSADFRTLWAAHNIVIHNRGTKHFQHPTAGPLSLAYHSVNLPISASKAEMMTVCTAEPGSADEDRLRLLASWVAPQNQTSN